MAVTFPCPACRAALKFAVTVPPGKQVRCPQCAAVFPMPAEGVRSGPPPAQPPIAAGAAVVEAMPRRVREDEDFNDLPRQRVRRRRKKGGSGLLVGLLVGAGVLVLVGIVGVVGTFVWLRALPDWREFTSAEGQFSVALPGTPVDKPRKAATAVGQVDYHSYELELPRQGMSFAIAYFDFPVPVVSQQQLNLAFESRRKQVLEAASGKVAREETITLNGHPGRDIEFTIPDKPGRGYVRMLFVKPRMYLLLLDGPRVGVDSPEAKRFFESFRVTGAAKESDVPREPAAQPPLAGRPGWPPVADLPGVPPPMPLFGPEQTVTLRISNLNDNSTRQIILDRLPTLTDGNGHSMQSTTQGVETVVTLAPVADPKAFAAKLDIGEVTKVDGRVIHVRAKKFNADRGEK